MNEKSAGMDEFARLDFRKVGDWKLANGNMTFELTQKETWGNFIYAFVSDGKIKFMEYSRLPLEARMDAYKQRDHRYAGTFQPMNKRLREKILVTLEEGETVEIWAFYPGEEHIFKGYRVNMAAGLFDSLVKAFSPEWNGYLR